MRMRYYLRGLGIGIVVTALLMGFTKGGQKETLTDAEIVERAKSLGMVESSVLSADLGNKEEISVNDISEVNQQEAQQTQPETQTDNLTQTQPEAKTDNLTQTDSEKETENNSSTQIDSEKEIEKDNPAKTDLENNTENDKTKKTKPDAETVKSDQADSAEKRYVVSIYSGDGSRTVANRLEEMGVIEDAAEFDRYLCQNGYDKRLTTGNHEIKAGADEKEIAEALVKRVN